MHSYLLGHLFQMGFVAWFGLMPKVIVKQMRFQFAMEDM